MRYASPRVRCMPTIYGTSQYLAKKVVMTTSFLLKNSILLHRKKSDEDYSRGRKKKRDDWLVAMVITFPRQVSASPFSLVPYAQGGVNLSSSLLFCLVIFIVNQKTWNNNAIQTLMWRTKRKETLASTQYGIL